MGNAKLTQTTLDHPGSKYYTDKKWLYEQYWQNERIIKDIADEIGVCRETIINWMNRFGIPRRNGNSTIEDYLFCMRPRDWLFDQYWRKKKSTNDISREFGISNNVVVTSLKNKEPPIKIKPRKYAQRASKRDVSFDHPLAKTHPSVVWVKGYRLYNIALPGRPNNRVCEHRITAIGEWGLEAVKGKHVHHANGLKWLNVPKFDVDIPELENPNLIPLDPITHAKT